MKKICERCDFFRAGQGEYGSGLCISEKSKKKNKSLVFKNDKCIEFKRKKN